MQPHPIHGKVVLLATLTSLVHPSQFLYFLRLEGWEALGCGVAFHPTRWICWPSNRKLVGQQQIGMEATKYIKKLGSSHRLSNTSSFPAAVNGIFGIKIKKRSNGDLPSNIQEGISCRRSLALNRQGELRETTKTCHFIETSVYLSFVSWTEITIDPGDFLTGLKREVCTCSHSSIL